MIEQLKHSGRQWHAFFQLVRCHFWAAPDDGAVDMLWDRQIIIAILFCLV